MIANSTSDTSLSLPISEVESMNPETELASILLQTTLQSKASEALCIPEILSDVFKCLKQDKKALRTLASVNRTWFQEATRLLWREASSKALISVEESRRNIYAPKIRKLTVHHASSHAQLHHCNFTSLRALCFDIGAEDVKQEEYSQYLRPTLEEVFFMALPPDDLLHGLNQHCPRLRVFVQGLHAHTDRSDLADFLTKNQSLQIVKLVSESEGDSSTLFQALSKMPYLEDLSLKGQISESVLRQLLESSAETLDLPRFNTLSKVEITVGVPALSLLRPTFGAMTSLTLDILIEKESHELDALAHLPLESLQLHIAAGVRFSSQELLFLHNAKNLQSLSIRPKPWSPTITMPNLTISNDHFRQIFANLSSLKRLLIWFSVRIRDTHTALLDLGRSCPKLENLRMYCTVELASWTNIPTPLFPSLTFLWIASVNDDRLELDPSGQISEHLAALIDKNAPKLDRFVAINNYAYRPTEARELSKYVMRAHGRIKEISQTRHSQHDNDR
jgi:hypothetical protein